MRQDAKVAIVTGAATGIGHASAKALREAGFRVFGTSRRAVASIADGITMIPCDVTDDASVKAAVDKVLDTTGRIDVLVNNAGTGLLAGAEELSVSQAQALFDVNLFGVIRTTNAVLPIMRNQKAGRIVNISSVLGLIPAPFSAIYSSTKHALEGYSESPRSRGADVRHSNLLDRAGIYPHLVRPKHGASGSELGCIRLGARAVQRTHARGHEDSRQSRDCCRAGRGSRDHQIATSAIHLR